MSADLDFISQEGIQKIKESLISGALKDIKGKLSEMDVKLPEKEEKVSAPDYTPRYDAFSLADHATNIYKTNVKEEQNEAAEDDNSQPVTIASKVNARALARALVGLRNGGDAGRPVALAGPNGGNVGIGCSSPVVGVMAMSVEEYENHINQMFLVEDEDEETIEQEPELLVETLAVTVLEDTLLQMEDISWQSIDKVMRHICVEHGLTPKQLHKDFKAKHGMIPDEWAKQHQMTEEVGWYPLDEMARIFESIGGVYEVVFMFRGGRQRLKFFWPSPENPTEEDMQKACEKFWPGARLLTFYLAHEDPGNYSHNTMVIVPPVTENFEVLPDDLWDFMSEEDSEIFDDIATEVGEPVSPVYLTEEEDEFEVDVADHDTGEIKTVVFGEGKRGLWDNIHAKRKRGEKAAKPGEKGYPPTLNVEGMENAEANVGGASKCWPGYKRAGTKKKAGKEVPNCVKEEEYIDEAGRCWKGYKPKKGKKPFSSGSCVKEEDETPKVEQKYKRVMERQETRNAKCQEKAHKKYGQIDEISKDLATKAYAQRRTNEFEGDELHTKSDKTHNRIVNKFGKKAGKDADKAANKQIFGEGNEMKGMSQKSGDKRSTDSGAGMTAKGVAKYNSRTGGNLKTAVTTPPSKLKAGSKAAGRRKSFCARSRGWNGERGKAARRRWNC